MADLSIWELFETDQLTAVYRESVEAERPNPLYDFLTGGVAGTFELDEVRVLTLGEVAKPAPLNELGHPARVLDLGGLGDAKLTAIRAYNVLPITGRTLDLLRSFEFGRRRTPSPAEASLIREGEGILGREMRRMARRHVLTKHVYAAHSVSRGMIYVGGDGYVQEDATDARVSIPTGIPAANMGAVNPGGVDLVPAAAPWTTAGTKILDQLDAINDHNAANGRLPIRHVWLNTTRRAAVRANTQMQAEFDGGTGVVNSQWIAATREDQVEVGRYLFHFFGETYETRTGARVPYIPANKAVLLPEADGDWYVHGDGRTPIPTDLGIHATLAEAMAAFTDTYGDFSYLATMHNTFALHVFAGFCKVLGSSAPENIYVPTIAA